MKTTYQKCELTGFTFRVDDYVSDGKHTMRVEIANELFVNSEGVMQAYPFPKPLTEAEKERNRKLAILLK